MDDLEIKIVEAADLVNRSIENREFHEFELVRILDYFYAHSTQINKEKANRTRILFTGLVVMDKSHMLGFDLYSKLALNPFPFTEEILRLAVRYESSYNNNDAALKSYIAVACRNAGISNDITNSLLQQIPDGHYEVYIDKIRGVGGSRPTKEITIPDGLKETLLFAATQDRFEDTRAKALCAIVYFDIKDDIPKLRTSMKSYSQELTKLGYVWLSRLASTATALEYLTADNKYKELVDFIIPEIRLVRHSENFIQTLTRKINDLVI